MSNEGRYLDIETWSRRAQFVFFQQYDQPFFGLCADVKVTATRRWCRAHQRSFALAAWYCCQRAINEVEPFRYRMRGDRVWVHDRVAVATTIAKADESFRFCHFPYADSFDSFCAGAQRAMAEPEPEQLEDKIKDDAIIHGSTVPWLRFSAVAQPRRHGHDDSAPKIVFGKAVEEAGDVVMPVAVDVHHSLMDGRHVSQLYRHLEDDLARPDEVL